MPQPQTSDPLAAAVNEVLIAHLSNGLKASIDAALAKGATKATVLKAVRQITGRRSLTLNAVEAYLETK